MSVTIISIMLAVRTMIDGLRRAPRSVDLGDLW